MPRIKTRRLRNSGAFLIIIFAVFAINTAVAAQDIPDQLKILSSKPYAPVIKVLDTESSLGPLSSNPQTVTLQDLVRYHGHPCDGLVVASAAIGYGFKILFPDGIIDRTDMVAAVNGSPCYGDAAAYLTGARTRYHTLIIDQKLEDTWILHRRSTGKTVAVSLREGIKPKELPGLEKKLRSEGCDMPLIRRIQDLQFKYSEAVLASPPQKIFEIKNLSSFPYKFGPIRSDATKAGCSSSR